MILKVISTMTGVMYLLGMWIAFQSPGYVATGEVLSDPKDARVQLNKTPCGKSAEMVTFVPEVKRTVVNDTAVCPKGSERAGKRYKLEQVEQLAPPTPTPTPSPSKSPEKSAQTG